MENGSEMVTKSMFREGIDELARLVGKGFEAVGKSVDTMATKEELWAVERNLERKIDDVDMHLSAYATQWNREFEVHETQLRALEKRPH